jgi:hypothetical protein
MSLQTRSRLITVGVLLIAMCVLLPSKAAATGLTITPTADAYTLATTIVGTGINLTGQSLIGASTQQGTFTGGLAAGLRFDSGIVLTTGIASRAGEANTSETRGSATNTGGNADLTALSGGATFDQNVLSLTFTPVGTFISLEFVFASEEYHELLGRSFNDVFAFYLSGPGVPKTNLAVIPNTSTPINVDTVNCTLNSGYYTPNSSSSPCYTGSQLPIQYDGFVGVSQQLLATSVGLNVTAGAEYTLTLALADGQDRFFDSAIFVGTGSLIDPEPPASASLPEPTSLILVGAGLTLGAAVRRFKKQSV